ncbi:MAG: 3-deoxy-manno-octulosonate cytidylyltransferase [Caulobacteraceae bacterium]|nr:3-deoxy-manno-octulosonate cytidylyltransferase [Caulobacteraceae bacterium]
MNPIVVIPARMAATRLPDKPLADIGGLPMIVRALRQAEAAAVGPVVVAAGDQAIVEAVEAAGGRAVLTDPDLPSGSDRVLAALDAVDPEWSHDVVINLQGDMPFVPVETIRALAGLFRDQPGLQMGTLVAPEMSPADRTNPDVVKAVVSLAREAVQGRCLYFTRSTLYGEGPIWRHIGLYGYTRDALAQAYEAAPPTALEKREKLEQLRALELGIEIWAAVVEAPPLSVDNPADLEAARAWARTHP